MKTIRHPETCPLCEYSRRGLEPGRPCPECGLGLLHGAPVFDLSPVVWQVRLGALAVGSMTLFLSVVILTNVMNIRQVFPPGMVTFPLFGFLVAAWCIWLTIRKPLPTLLLFTIDGITFVYRGRVQWHIRYDSVAEHKGIWLLRVVILRDATGKRRTLTTETQKEQAAIMRAIADVLARYRSEGGGGEPMDPATETPHRGVSEEPLPDGRGSDGA